MKIQVKQILPSPEPVRTQMEPAKLDELSASIKEQGLIVPIKVRPIDDKYEIVYGHRRFAASQMAGLEVIECIVEGAENVLAQALIENIVREDMNDADKRDGLRNLKELTGKTWKEIGAMFGWSESYVKTIAGITDDEAEIIRIAGDTITSEHVSKARQAGDDSLKVLKKASKEGLSKRQVGAVAKSVAVTQDPRRKQQLIDAPYDPYTHDPDNAKARAERFGKTDPIAKPNFKPSTETWKDTPEVALLLQKISDFGELSSKAKAMSDEGKFSPEALPFVQSKVNAAYKKWQSMFEGWKQ